MELCEQKMAGIQRNSIRIREQTKMVPSKVPLFVGSASGRSAESPGSSLAICPSRVKDARVSLLSCGGPATPKAECQGQLPSREEGSLPLWTIAIQSFPTQKEQGSRYPEQSWYSIKITFLPSCRFLDQKKNATLGHLRNDPSVCPSARPFPHGGVNFTRPLTLQMDTSGVSYLRR